jgi:hypothetical protein
MTIILLILAALFLGFALFVLFKNRKLEDEMHRIQKESEQKRQYYESETQRVYSEAQAAVAEAQKQLDQQFEEVKQESERIRQHYEAEARRSQEAAEAMLAKTLKELEPLRKYESLRNAEEEMRRTLAEAVSEATALRKDAQTLLEQAKNATADERAAAIDKAKNIQEQADARLNQALRDAGRIVAQAEKRAEQIGGDAYAALREKQMLEQAAEAMRNTIEGYGDRYLVPTHTILDDLAADFGRTSAAQAFSSAREQSRRMVEQGEAATCDYVEAERRKTAIQFVIHAFNGSVDSILTRIKSDNYGILEQKIKDAFSIVNKDGSAFRNARILPAYLDARLAELKWGMTLYELNRQWQEEQRSRREEIRAQQRDAEEIARRQREAARETELQKQAVAEAEKQFANATAEMKQAYERKLEEARQKLVEATTRELTAAQMGKVGCVYIISNVGSFNYQDGIPTVFKIGMTRRPKREDRIDELSNASVPFAFDIHALIKSEDAPALETKLHHVFRDNQVNKNNFRKEFFRVSLPEIRIALEKLKEQGMAFEMERDWLEKATAEDFYRSRKIETDPKEMDRWRKEQEKRANRLARESWRVSDLDEVETNGNNGEK